MKLLAIDGNSIINRAFYGIKLLSTKDGTFTNGIYGFLNILFKLLDDVNPDAVAAAFDCARRPLGTKNTINIRRGARACRTSLPSSFQY